MWSVWGRSAAPGSPTLAYPVGCAACQASAGLVREGGACTRARTRPLDTNAPARRTTSRPAGDWTAGARPPWLGRVVVADVAREAAAVSIVFGEGCVGEERRGTAGNWGLCGGLCRGLPSLAPKVEVSYSIVPPALLLRVVPQPYVTSARTKQTAETPDDATSNQRPNRRSTGEAGIVGCAASLPEKEAEEGRKAKSECKGKD